MSLPAIRSDINRRLGIPIWTTRDGREIPLDELDDRHIANAITKLAPWRRDCRKRGEREMARVLDDTLRILKREQRSRGRRQRRSDDDAP